MLAYGYIASILIINWVSGIRCNECCDPNSSETVTMAKIEVARSMIFSDPEGAIAIYDRLFCPGACIGQPAQALLAIQKAFNTSLIDLELVLETTNKQFTAILLEHIKNTDPKLALTLTLFIDGFLACVMKTEFFLCDTNHAINDAFNTAIPVMTNQMTDAYTTIRKLISCTKEHNIHVGAHIFSQLATCLHKGITIVVTEFNKFFSILDTFKSLVPRIVVEVYECLVTEEPNSDLLVMLTTSKCISRVQAEGVKEYLGLLGNASLAVPDLVSKIQASSMTSQKCSTFYVEKFRSELNAEHNNHHCARSS